jgi:di- and tripeptidase
LLPGFGVGRLHLLLAPSFCPKLLHHIPKPSPSEPPWHIFGVRASVALDAPYYTSLNTDTLPMILADCSFSYLGTLSATMPSVYNISSPTSPTLKPILDDLATPKLNPELVHTLKHDSTVLALAVCPELGRIYAGTQDGEIVAWSLETFQPVHTIQAHKRSVLSLFLSPDNSFLFSSAGDPIINIWCPKTLSRLYEVYSTHDVGDIFCTAYSPQYDTLYFGAQNSSIQWISPSDLSTRVSPESERHPSRRNHRFFDSKAVGGGSATPRRNDEKWSHIPRPQAVLEVDNGAIRNFAHNGYVYCMLMAKGPTVEADPERDVLISGAGDGTIKLWNLRGKSQHGEDDGSVGGIEEIMTLGTDDADSVLSMAIDGSFLYAGKLDGIVELWDLDTSQKLRVLKAHESDIMSLQMGWGFLWTASANGGASVRPPFACLPLTIHRCTDTAAEIRNRPLWQIPTYHSCR